MRKKVIRTMIILVIAFLISFYFIKIFFPKWFVLQVENERLIRIGNYIDKHLWLYELCSIITSFVTYFLYLGAVKSKLLLNWKEIVSIFIAITITHLFYWFDNCSYTTISIVSFLILPLLDKQDNKKEILFTLSTHLICQMLSLRIRNITAILNTFNYLTLFVMTMESYFWLLLLYLYFNYNKIFKKGE